MTITNAEYERTTGLGNKLFPWSRAKILASEKGYGMPQQIWFSPRGASVTRGGIDYTKALNKIWLCNNFINDKSEINLLKYRIYYKNSFKKIYGNSLDEAKLITSDNSVIIFKFNVNHNFIDLQGYQEEILNYLLQITRSSEKLFLERFNNKDFIGLNIRTGNDFVNYNNEKKNGFYKTSLKWFINSIKVIRKQYGDLPGYIISDGGIKELGEILKEDNLFLIDTKTAISDLLLITKAKVLLGSGNSTFSAWASFLGRMDTYSAPETPFTKFQINLKQNNQVISTIDY
jgi:hypothetical protein